MTILFIFFVNFSDGLNSLSSNLLFSSQVSSYIISALTSISIPKNVTQIAQYAFSDCTSLTRVEVKAAVPPTIFSETFDNSTALKIYVPKESIDAYKAANYWKDLNLLAK